MGEFRETAMWLEELQVKLGMTISMLNELDASQKQPQRLSKYKIRLMEELLSFYEELGTKCVDLSWQTRMKWLSPASFVTFYPLTDDYIVKFKHAGGIKAQDLTKLDFLVIHKKLLSFLEDMVEMGVDFRVSESFFHRKSIIKPRMYQHELGKAIDISLVGLTGREFYDKYKDYFIKHPHLKVVIADNYIHIEATSRKKPFMQQFFLNKNSRGCNEFYTRQQDMSRLFCKHYQTRFQNEPDNQDC